MTDLPRLGPVGLPAKIWDWPSCRRSAQMKRSEAAAALIREAGHAHHLPIRRCRYPSNSQLSYIGDGSVKAREKARSTLDFVPVMF